MNPLRHALRVFTNSPGYAAVTVAILALGIGATTAIFSVVHAVLLKPLSYADSARLVQISTQSREGGSSVFAPATFVDLERQTKSFAAVAAHQYYYVNLTKTQSPARLTEMRGSRDYFKVLGVAPLLGRTWSPEEARVGAAPVVVLSAATWRTQFNADPKILSQTILLDDVAHTVIGVMPDGFGDPWGDVALWRPYLDGANEFQDRKSRYMGVYGRLADGVTLEAARAEVATFNAQLQQAFPELHRDWTIELDDLHLTGRQPTRQEGRVHHGYDFALRNQPRRAHERLCGQGANGDRLTESHATSPASRLRGRPLRLRWWCSARAPPGSQASHRHAGSNAGRGS